MPLPEYGPGKSRRIQLNGVSDRYSTAWVIFSARRSANIYICPRMLGGAVKISLHESGSWQVGLTSQAAAERPSTESRHWEVWKRGGELAPGTVRAWYLLIPDHELRFAAADGKAYQLPPVGSGHAVSLEVLMVSNEGPTANFDDAHLVGRWRLQGRSESCLVVARRIPWPAAQQSWADVVRKQVAAQAEAAGVPRKREHRYYAHGHDPQGVRFGLELAADADR